MAYIKYLSRASDGGWLLNFAADGSDEFHDVLDELKFRIPPDGREWLPDRRCWWIESEYDLRLLSDLLMDLDAAIAATAKGGAASGHSPRGDPSSAGGSVYVPADVQQAFSTLHLLPSAPPELVSAARRLLARQHHPDAGGTHTEMVSVNRAADRAEQWAERHAGKAGAA